MKSLLPEKTEEYLDRITNALLMGIPYDMGDMTILYMDMVKQVDACIRRFRRCYIVEDDE